MYVNHTPLSTAEQKILEMFLDTQRHYFAEITKKTGLTRPRTLRSLRKLTEIGLFQIKEEANVKFYSAARNPMAYAVLGIIEYNRTADFLGRKKILKRAIEMFDSEYRDYLIMLIFGSHAKGYAASESDIDLLLVKEDFSKADAKRIENLSGIINGRTGLKISPYLMKVDEFRQKKEFVKEVIDNHIILSGAELFMRMVLE